jgi:DNA-binding response OmpR family regulator/nitrogen-specific signal transduction histidine kinase
MEHMETEKLQEIDHMKSRFFANISHEFRTPLTLILGPLSEMLMKKGEPSEKQGLKLMERSARRLQQLINQLLDLSKLESGKMILQVQETELLSFINRIVQSFESQAKIKRINLSFSTELKFAYAWIDNEKMENIMNNLLSNAFKFTNKGGRIEVGIKNIPLNPPSEADFTISPLEGELQGGVCITVSDTGRGIPLDNQDHIFDRFYQVDDSYSKDEEGSGIGLALTKELVDLHLGRIEVKSEVGIGSTFSIYLPLGKEHLRPEQVIESKTEKTDEEISLTDSPCLAVGQAFEEGVREMSATELPQEDYTRRVTEGVSESRHLLLVVEDNSDMRLYIRGNLENDYEIVEAEDGDAGYKVCIKSLPDLIISDVMMPKMDGFEFCQKVKSDERTSHIPLILLTARAEMTDKLGGLDQGADDYLTKPFNVIELRTRIRNILEQRRRLHTRFQREAATQPREIAVSSLDEQFLNRALNIIERHMDEPGFEVTNFAREMGISRAHLYNKLEALTGQSAKEFIRTVRLKRGAQLIRKKAGNISQIAYEVGFNNPSYFSHCFCSQFGLSPSEYARQDKN